MNKFIQYFFTKLALLGTYLFLNCIDLTTFIILIYYNTKIKELDNIAFCVFLSLNLILETFTFYYKFIQLEKALTTFIFKLSMNWCILSLSIYILCLVLNFDNHSVNHTQRILFPIIKTMITILNIHVCKIRYLTIPFISPSTIYNKVNNDNINDNINDVLNDENNIQYLNDSYLLNKQV